MKEVTDKTVVPDRWIPDGHDYILHLGTMRKAVVVSRCVKHMSAIYSGDGSWYSISGRSYFPFTDAQMDKKFNTAIEAIGFAETIILEWLNSITMGFTDNKSPQKKLETNQTNHINQKGNEVNL